ncbi:SDR family NAD(P)-dependent oxidoreductase [Mycolicibacterium setense]
MTEPDPIAIVGIAVRVPGSVNRQEFWRHLRDGVDAISDRGSDRVHGPDRGGFVSDVDMFDAAFFGMTPSEATSADPQQRIALELAWHAIEDAGLVPGSTVASRTGVFFGVMSSEYADLLTQAGTSAISAHTLSGLGRAMVANRISRSMQLSGPSLVVDAGQSSSLVAVHLACESIRRAESDIALAGGVHLNLSPLSTAIVGATGALSPEGRPYVFDERANGYVRGEGGGVVVLKRLQKALDADDHIYAVIQGSALGTGTSIRGITVPSVDAQARTLTEALNNAGLSPADVHYVELHGTGTPVGDPIEASALGSVYGRAPRATGPLVVGSVKSNIGHLEAGAGIAGLIKTALCIDQREIVPTISFERANSKIDLEALRLRVAIANERWPLDQPNVAAGVSSFSIGGSCCHMLLTAAPTGSPTPRRAGRRVSLAGPVGVFVSGRGEIALREQAKRLRSHVAQHRQINVADVGYSSITTRAQFDQTAVVVAADRDALLAGLTSIAEGQPSPHVVKHPPTPGKTAFLFSGQGAQRAGMGKELAARHTVFAHALDEVCTQLTTELDRPLQELLFAEPGSAEAALLDSTQFTQPALFAVEVALFRLVESLGLQPDYLIGHSVGELAAAHVAGVLSLPDACTLVTARGRLMGALPAGGAMVAIQATEDEVSASLNGFQHQLSIAAINGPRAVVVSGDRDHLHQWVSSWTDRKTTWLRVSHAFHSPRMDPMLDEFRSIAASLSFTEPTIPIVSNLHARPVTTELTDPNYWANHVRQPVRFHDGIHTLTQHGVRRFYELGPDSVLTALAQQSLDDDTITFSPALQARQPEPHTFATLLAHAHLAGNPIDWQTFYTETPAQRTPLPTYAFQHQRYWINNTHHSNNPTPTGLDSSSGDSDDAPLTRLLSSVAESEWEHVALEIVRSESLSALGSDFDTAIDPARPFEDLGFDSLAGIELRNRLVRVTGIGLPSTLIFDYPSPQSVARLLITEFRADVHHRGSTESEPPTPAQNDNETDDPVVIVGMACRFPGAVSSPEDLWKLLVAEQDAISALPDDRGWDLQRLYDADPEKIGTVYNRGGGYLNNVGHFDAAFFDIRSREATAMDPQQRILLEGAWEAFEDAGIDPTSLRGSSTGVFCGIMPSDYGLTGSGIEGLQLTGTTTSVASGRVAYTLGLEGPAISVDTACSSALVALHLAAQSLRSGECSLALAGGVTVLATPFLLVEFSRQQGFSPDGRCKPFSAAADGTAFSDGLGLLVLQRLSDARRDGHTVLAVVRGSAINQDGASNGLTAPNGPSQERVIRQALANAGLNAQDVDAVEAHGTGTRLGDPIEANALLATYGRNRKDDLHLGSIKSNIGHTVAAAGAAGVIKMVQAMRYGVLPRSLHVDDPSPHVDWDTGRLRLLQEAQPWPAVANRPRRAGVSSFGISGTNAHVIIEEPPAELATAAPPPTLLAGPVGVFVSGRGEIALREQAKRLRSHVAQHRQINVVDVGYSSITTRAQFDQTAVVVAADRDALLAGLTSIAEGQPSPHVVKHPPTPGKTAFLFSGQGAQRAGMGKELAARHTVFAHALDEVCTQLTTELDRPLQELLFAEPGSAEAALLDSTQFTQPALFAVEVALFRLVESLGLQPDYLIGHSVGELAAAHVAGVLSLPDACTLVTARGRLMGALPAGGAMVAIQATEDEVSASLNGFQHQLSIAAINGPRAVVVSGDRDHLHQWVSSWTDRKTTWLRVSHAFHSPRMDPMLDEFRSIAASLSFTEPTIPIVSNLHARPVTTELTDPNYWANHVRQPVRFHDGIHTLTQHGVRRFYELGPDSVLTALAQQSLDDDTITFSPALQARQPEPHTFATLLAHAHLAGNPIDWQTFYTETPAQRTPLPTYAFQHQRYWINNTHHSNNPTPTGLDRIDHPVLCGAVAVADRDEWLFTGETSLATASWLHDHAILDSVVMPGTALVDLAMAAGDHVSAGVVEELVIDTPLFCAVGETVQLQVTVSAADSDQRREVAIYSHVGHDSRSRTCHARGVLTAQPIPSPTAWATVWPPRNAEEITADTLYEKLAAIGYIYGQAFQGVERLWRLDESLYGEVELAESLCADLTEYQLHPALFDSLLHVGLLDTVVKGTAALPYSWSGVQLGGSTATRLRVRIQPTSSLKWRIDAVDSSNHPVISINELALRPIDSTRFVRREQRPSELFTVDWVPAPTTDIVTSSAIVAIGEFDGIGARFDDLNSLEQRITDGMAVPDAAYIAIAAPDTADNVASITRSLTYQTLRMVQQWLASDPLANTRLAIVTRNGIAIDDEPTNLAHSCVWGLVRSAQSEHPGRLVLIDIDSHSTPDWASLVATDQPQIVVRHNRAHTPQLSAAPTTPIGPWRLTVENRGSLDGLSLIGSGNDRPLKPHEIRLHVGAVGLNFRDVLIALNMYPGDAPLGSEAAGTVLEVGRDVTGVSPGDRVMGLIPDCIGSIAIADHGMVVLMPDSFSFEQAAAIPVAYLTAFYGLHDLAQLKRRQRLLVHAGAGGVGMAAVNLARHWGAEIYATASPAKWDTLRAMGIEETHLASSRTTAFGEQFLKVTAGEGVDIVLNALAGDYVDTSMDLLPRGGQFLEIGKTDIRDRDQLARSHPGVSYQAFDVFEAGPQRLHEILQEIVTLFERKVLHPAPTRLWDMRQARDAFRFLREGHNIGKVVLTAPTFADPQGLVLITGGTGGLGAKLARHLVTHHGVRNLLLLSRRGQKAPGISTLTRELHALGARVQVRSCNIADRTQLTAVLESVDQSVSAVVHAAGVLDDTMIESMTLDQLDRVLIPKVDGAVNLHELTLTANLKSFVMFSSVSGQIGTPGQSNYAAANTFLDALAASRRAAGLPATSLAWGLWSTTDGMAGQLTEADVTRWNRVGIRPLPTQHALHLFDQTQHIDSALFIAADLNTETLQRRNSKDTMDPLLSSLVGLPRGGPAPRPKRSPRARGNSLEQRLSSSPETEWEAVALEAVHAAAISVLGYEPDNASDPDRAFRDLGFDSLAGVELRNQLAESTAIRLPSTLIFDYPTARAVARRLIENIKGVRSSRNPGIKPSGELEQHVLRLKELLADLPEAARSEFELRPQLVALDSQIRSLLTEFNDADDLDTDFNASNLDGFSDEEMFRLIDKEIGQA